MNIKQLECFVRVAELGSFTKASAMLGISQSVLSRQVRQLELDIRKHLLHRNGRGVSTTEHGERLLAHGRGILRQIELARMEFADAEKSPLGKVIVGMPPSVGKLLTVHTVTRFRQRFPKASIGIVDGLTTTMQEWLLLGRLDFALLYNPQPIAELDYQHAGSEHLYLISPNPRGIPMPATARMNSIAKIPLIIPSRPNAVRTFIESEFDRKHVPLNVVLEIDSIPAVIDLVAREMGHAILPHYAIQDHALRKKLHAARIVSPPVVGKLVIATSTQRPLTSLAEQTIALVKSVIAREMSKIEATPLQAA